MDLAGKVWLCTPSAVEAEAVRHVFGGEGLIYVTGVGAVATMEALWHRFHNEKAPSAIIVLGIAGTYDPALPLYTGVQIRKEFWGALGRRTARRLTPLPPGLTQGFPIQIESLAPALSLPQVTGLTLESVSACRKEAAFWKRNYPEASIETQENAAYLRFGEVLRVPVYALRVVSNRVGERHWDRSAALEALGTFARNVGLPLYERLMDSAAPAGPRI